LLKGHSYFELKNSVKICSNSFISVDLYIKSDLALTADFNGFKLIYHSFISEKNKAI